MLAILLGLAGTIAVVLGLVVYAALRALLVKEAEAAVPALTRDLLRRSEERLPEEHRPRFREETAAGLRETIEQRPLLALVQAASLYRAAVSGRLAAEFEPAAVPARSGDAGRNSALGRINGLARRTLGRISPRRTVTWIWISTSVEDLWAYLLLLLRKGWSTLDLDMKLLANLFSWLTGVAMFVWSLSQLFGG